MIGEWMNIEVTVGDTSVGDYCKERNDLSALCSK